MRAAFLGRGWELFRRRLPRRVGAAEPLAAALADHHRTGRARRVRAERADGVRFEIETDEYFTLEGTLARLDRSALDRCRGRVLDVGAGAGRHALALEARGHAVVAIDVSPIAVELCRTRGVRDARLFDVMRLDVARDSESAALGRFDSILFGMQTIGVAGGRDALVRLLERLAPLLVEGGEVIVDSSALREAWDGDVSDDSPTRGEIVLSTRYRGWRGENFPWLYIAEPDLEEVAKSAGYAMEAVDRVESGEYLAALRLEESP